MKFTVRFPKAVLGVLASILLAHSWAGEPPAMLRISGLINLPSLRQALVSYRIGKDGPIRTSILREGERESELEVLKIDPATEEVTVNHQQFEGPAVFKLNGSPKSDLPITSQFKVHLDRASGTAVFKLYGRLKGRTVLRSAKVNGKIFSIDEAVANEEAAAKALETVFAQQGLATIIDGDKFVMIVAKEDESKTYPHAKDLSLTRPAGEKPSVPPELIPANGLNFEGVTLTQVMSIYAELVNSRFDPTQQTTDFGDRVIFINSGGPLTKEEAIYALKTLIGWEGFDVVGSPEGQLKLVHHTPLSLPGPPRVKETLKRS
jgi:hypothetical protein